jgi:hypothetical protein
MISGLPNYIHHSARYHHQGWTLISAAVPRAIADDWGRKALDGRGLWQHTQRAATIGDCATNHSVIRADDVIDHFPTLYGFYLALPLIVEPIVSRPVVLSPHPRSAVTINVYETGASHRWHFDTNAVTALLYLTDDRNPTTLIDLQGEKQNLDFYHPGDLLVMQGRRVNHCVPPVSGRRVTVPLNLYHPDDTHRPANQDSIVYGEKS